MRSCCFASHRVRRVMTSRKDLTDPFTFMVLNLFLLRHVLIRIASALSMTMERILNIHFTHHGSICFSASLMIASCEVAGIIHASSTITR